MMQRDDLLKVVQDTVTDQVVVPVMSAIKGWDEIPEYFFWCTAMGYGSSVALGLALAKALGDHTAVARLSAAAEAAYEPHFFGEDDQGRVVAAGAYYVNVDMDGYSVTRRVLLLKP